MNRQLMFNTAFLGLKAQGFQQAHSSELQSCQYRDEDGRKCAIGQCIPDQFYESDMDEYGYGPEEIFNSSRELAAIYDLEAHNIGTADLGFMQALQCVHDESGQPATMEHALRRFAEQYDLTVPTP